MEKLYFDGLNCYVLAVGSSEGFLHIVTRRSHPLVERWSKQIGVRLHMMDIKDVEWTSEFLITAGVDNNIVLS